MSQENSVISGIRRYFYDYFRDREEHTIKKISYVQWEPFHSVHVDVLDEQHRKLFDIVNDLIDEIEMGSNRLLPIIHELVDFLAVHFRQEHIVMVESNYPDLLKHEQEHQRFNDKAAEFFQEYRQGDIDLEYKWITYLKAWVYEHTTRQDMRYGEHLLKNAGKFTPSWR